MHTLHQQRAERAYQFVNEVAVDDQAHYKRFAKHLPALIQACGLAQAIAYGQAKGDAKTPQARAIRAVCEDLARLARGRDLNSFADESRSAPLLDYLKLSRDALACAGWLKRYAEALIAAEED